MATPIILSDAKRIDAREIEAPGSATSAVRRRGRHAVRLFLATGAGLAVAWLSGFAWFFHLATWESKPVPHVDAIVVLTGGPDRVEVALHLLAGGAANRLLVSGAGDRTDLAVLAHLAGIDPAPLEQQITLGHAARSTRGNALETAAWSREQGIGSLLVVTAWFHMPRALIELHRALPEVTVHAHPVGRFSAADLSRAGVAWRVISEYHKFLAAAAGLTASPFTSLARGADLTG
jgi:uncharacterized SAM-binding protein YcdF (DUF218 family)